MFPGCGLCTNIGRALSSVKIALDPEVLPFSSFLYPSLHNRVTNSSNVKSDGVAMNRSISFSLVLMRKCN